MKRFLSLALCFAMLFSLLLVFPAKVSADTIDLSAYSDQSGDLSVTPPTKEQIKAMWEGIATYQTKFDIEPSVTAPYSIGKLNADYLQSGEDYLNLIRYIAGLPSIELSDELNESAQYGAVVLAANNVLTHYPEQPADMDDDFYQKGYEATTSSNLSSGYSTLSGALLGCLNDADYSNIAAVGHRRWLLNPTLHYVGLGQASYYIATKVFDRSGAAVDYNFVSWPPSGNCPSNIFYKNTPWSITLNPSKYNRIAPDFTITLTRISDGKTWTFNPQTTSSDPYTADCFLNVNLQGYGVSNCVIFRPPLADISGYNGLYTVEMTGIYDKNESAVTLRYQTEFFDLNYCFNHEYESSRVAPTCTVDGYDSHTCVICQHTYTDNPVPATGHTEVSVSTVAPTCTEVGYTSGTKCSSCGKIFTGCQEIPALGHSYSVESYPADLGGDCTVNCRICGNTESFATNTSMTFWWNTNGGNSYSSYFAKEFDVGETLYLWDNDTIDISTEKNVYVSDESAITYIDSAYDDDTFTFNKEGIYTFTIYYKYAPHVYRTYTVYVGNTDGMTAPTPFIPHGGTTDVVTSPTCTEGGYTTHSCSVCDYAHKDKETNAKGHNIVNDSSSEPNCTDVGYTAGSHCDVCGEVFVAQTEIPANGHKPITVPYKAPTCTEVGYTEGSRCSVCGEILSGCEEIPANGHNEVIDEVVNSTCTDVGYTQGSHCDVCGEVFIAQQEIPARGHTTYVISYPKTKGGECTIGCKYCDYTETFATNESLTLLWSKNGGSSYSYSLGSTFAVGDVVYLWDYDNVDISTEKIINIADESATVYTPATNKYDDDIFTFAKEGIYTFTVYYKYAPHVYRTYTVYVGNTDGMEEPQRFIPHGKTTTVVTPSTCTEGGYTTDECSVCEYAYKYNETSAKGHKIVNDKAVEPTCTEVGYTSGSHCETCGEVFVAQTEIAAKGHTEVTEPYVAPTCTEKGYTEGKTCSVCREVIKLREEIDATGHTEVIDKAIEPTCTEVGYTEGSHCDTCGEVFVAQTEISAKGHDLHFVSYAETAGGKAIFGCDCGYKTEIETPSEISVLWNRNGGGDYFNEKYFDIFETAYTVGGKLFGCNIEQGMGGEIVIEVSDPDAIKWEYVGDNKYVFEFLKEGTYTFTISYKYSPTVSKTYTVNVEELEISNICIGDVNQDGEIDKKDYAMLKRYCFDTAYLTPEQLVAADINADDNVSKQDYALLKRFCFGTYTIE